MWRWIFTYAFAIAFIRALKALWRLAYGPKLPIIDSRFLRGAAITGLATMMLTCAAAGSWALWVGIDGLVFGVDLERFWSPFVAGVGGFGLLLARFCWLAIGRIRSVGGGLVYTAAPGPHAPPPGSPADLGGSLDRRPDVAADSQPPRTNDP